MSVLTPEAIMVSTATLVATAVPPAVVVATAVRPAPMLRNLQSNSILCLLLKGMFMVPG